MKINDKQSQQIATILTAVATILLSGALTWYFTTKAISINLLYTMVSAATFVYMMAVLVLGVKHADRS